MKIIIESKDDRALIVSLCDVALKAGGMNSKNGVDYILASMEDAPKTPKEEKGK